MRVAIIDVDLLDKGRKHRFPNLVSMKLSSFHKMAGDSVELKLDYNDLGMYDAVFLSKVFEDTVLPDEVLLMSNVKYGGTGFFFDKAPKLPMEIEHIIPDYNLYSKWADQQLRQGKKRSDYKEYLDVSIGFTTRGCIRGCKFCVNQNCTESVIHSRIEEFYDPAKKYICLLDDNVFACKDWKMVFEELISIGKPFYYKQGLDERLLTEEKCDYLFNKSNYHGDYTFAFDKISDYDLIKRKLDMIRSFTEKVVKFYVFCGFNQYIPYSYSDDFWLKDIEEVFIRIKLLMEYRCLPYIMRFKDYILSPYKGMYVTLARWCNQPSYFKKMTFRQFCYFTLDNGSESAVRYMQEFERKHPDIARKYFDMRFKGL